MLTVAPWAGEGYMGLKHLLSFGLFADAASSFSLPKVIRLTTLTILAQI